MSRVLAVALNTFREAIRDKLLYVLLCFACLLILSSWVIGQLSLSEGIRVTKDLGLWGISLFGVVLAVFVGVNLVYKEIERKTIYALVPKPIHRWQLIAGKYIGMVITLAAQMALMASVMWLAIVVQGGTFDGVLLRAIVLLYAQVMVVTAIAVLFSTFSSPFLSGLFTVGLFVIGRSTPELHALILQKFKEEPATASLLRAALHAFPDLHLFYVSGAMVAGKRASIHAGDYVDWGYVAWTSGYGAAYAACALGLAMLIFSRRDFV